MNPRVISLLLATTLLYSCFSERMYVSVSQQSVISCMGFPITKLEIRNNDRTEHYLLSWEDADRSLPIRINFDSLDSGYTVYKNGFEIKASTKFRFTPNTSYYLGLGRVDTSELCVFIETDSVGRICDGWPKGCKQLSQ